MADYFCHYCGGRTSMMGHGVRHDMKLARVVDRVSEELGVERERVVNVMGQYQMGEIR